MKKTISRIWGVGLVLTLVVSLLLWSAPVAADTLEWDDEDIPSTDDFILLADEDIVSMAVAEDGQVIYALTGDTTIYVSTDKGLTWDDSNAAASEGVDSCDLVAVAPDDPRYIAIVDADDTDVIISDDAGATFDSLGEVNDTLTAYTSILAVAVSRESDDNRWIAVAADNGTGVAIAYYEIGAIGAEWTEITSGDMGSGFTAGDDEAAALAFSPNFHSDEILAAVTADATNNAIYFQMFSFNQEEWNDDAGFDDYPVDILGDTDDTFTAVDALAVALSPDYLGSDSDLRIAFVGAATGAGNETTGIFRLEDDDVDTLKDEEDIGSIAFDGSLLVAGDYSNNEVYYSTDPLASDPDVDDTTSMKAPGGVNKTLVGIAEDLVVAATSGDGSCFSISRNNGKSFNDVSLIDTDLDVLTDLAVSADGELMYLATWDSTTSDLSVWRSGGEDQEADWERILFDDSTNATNDYIIRIAPDDPNVVFLADVGGTNIYYNTDAGEGRWRTRASRYNIGDLAVETTGEVLYVLEDNASACYVSKSTNTGFTWGSKETTGLAQGDSVIVSLGEDLLLVGSDDGTVAYSTDGNESWTDLDDTMDAGGAVQVTATGLSDGDFIFAVTTGGDSIYRWELGEDDSWDDFVDLEDDPPADYSGYEFYGIAVGPGKDGEVTLYAIGTDGTDSVLIRVMDATDDADVGAADADDTDFSTTPSALRVSAGSTNLWTLDQENDALYNYEDTIATVGPTLKGPSNGFLVPVNEISGDTADVNFSWESPSDEVTLFDFEIAVDDDFDEVVFEFGSDTRDDVGGGDEGDTISFTLTDTDYDLMPGVTYYWRVRVNEEGPVQSPWSDTWSFTIEEAEAPPPVTVEEVPPPEVTVELPPPEVKVEVPPLVEVPPAPAPIAPAYIWAIIIIGAILVIALIVLIVRTRRVV